MRLLKVIVSVDESVMPSSRVCSMPASVFLARFSSAPRETEAVLWSTPAAVGHHRGCRAFVPPMTTTDSSSCAIHCRSAEPSILRWPSFGGA